MCQPRDTTATPSYSVLTSGQRGLNSNKQDDRQLTASIPLWTAMMHDYRQSKWKSKYAYGVSMHLYQKRRSIVWHNSHRHTFGVSDDRQQSKCPQLTNLANQTMTNSGGFASYCLQMGLFLDLGRRGRGGEEGVVPWAVSRRIRAPLLLCTTMLCAILKLKCADKAWCC